MKNEHTPGPWNPDTIRDPDIIWATGGVAVAQAVANEADRRLIAAAPDMLAALQLVVYRPDGWPNVAPGELVELAQRTKDVVKAAIAKATAQKASEHRTGGNCG